MRELQVVSWDLDRIRAYGKRLRKNDAAVGRMVRSIEAYGFCLPVLVTADGEIVDGDLRVKAARRMGWTEIPVLVCEGWSPEQVRGFRLMANQSSTWAKWDLAAVAVELAELRANDFDLDLTGFGDSDLGAIEIDWEERVCGECGRRVRA